MSDTPQLLLTHHLKALKLPTFLREYDKLAQQCAAEGVDASSRACIRYPSSLISCSQSEPSGAFSASAASCGLIQAGGEAGLTLRRVESVSVGFVRADFIIAAIYQEFAFL
jgi:hypothetical protein